MDAVTRALIDRYGVSVCLDVAASIAGFSDDKVRELLHAGRFPGHRAGTEVMVFVPELVEWMRNGGGAQYEPRAAGRAHARAHGLRRPRKADRPACMDRVRPPAPPGA